MIRVGIAGAGFMGRQHFSAYQMLRDAQVVAVSDGNADKAKLAAGDFGCTVCSSVEEMINSYELDVLDICLPTFLHKKYSMLAAAGGIHVLCEKPIAINLDDAREMMFAAKAAGVLLGIGHCLRFSREYTILKDYIADGRYGKLKSLRLYRNSPVPSWSENNWLLNNDDSGGAALDLHIHDVDMIMFLFGKPEAVLSKGSPDNILTIYDYPDIAVSAEASWRIQPEYPFNAGYDAVFEKAVFVFDLEKGLIAYKGSEKPYKISADELYEGSGFKISSLPDPSLYLYFAETRYFLNCIKESAGLVLLRPEDAIDSLEIVLSEIRGMKAGKFACQPIC